MFAPRADNRKSLSNRFDKSRVSPKTRDITGLPTWQNGGSQEDALSLMRAYVGTNRDSDLASTRLLRSKLLTALFSEPLISMGEQMIQLLIATQETFEVRMVSAALSETLSRVLCPLVCVSGCDGCVRGILMVSLLFVYCLPRLHLYLEPWIL